MFGIGWFLAEPCGPCRFGKDYRHPIVQFADKLIRRARDDRGSPNGLAARRVTDIPETGHYHQAASLQSEGVGLLLLTDRLPFIEPVERNEAAASLEWEPEAARGL